MGNDTFRAPIKLTDQQKQDLINMEGDIAWLEAELAKAKRAGIADPDQEARVKELILKRKGILDNYS